MQSGETAELTYDRKAKGYRLINSRSVKFTNAELYTIKSILLDSRSLNKKEMSYLVMKLVDACRIKKRKI